MRGQTSYTTRSTTEKESIDRRELEVYERILLWWLQSNKHVLLSQCISSLWVRLYTHINMRIVTSGLLWKDSRKEYKTRGGMHGWAKPVWLSVFLPPSEKVTWESFNRLYPSYDWRWLWYIRYHEVSVCSHDTESSLSSHLLPKIFQKEEEDSRKKTEELKMQSNMEWQECEDRQDWIKVPL